MADFSPFLPEAPFDTDAKETMQSPECVCPKNSQLQTRQRVRTRQRRNMGHGSLCSSQAETGMWKTDILDAQSLLFGRFTVYTMSGFLNPGIVTSWVRSFFIVGSALHIVGCLATTLAVITQMVAALFSFSFLPTPAMTTKLFPGGVKCPLEAKNDLV